MTPWVRWFAQPWALWLLLAVPIVTLLLVWARWRRGIALRQLGAPFLVAPLVRLRPRWRRAQNFLLTLGLTCLALGVAGPRWGLAARTETLDGRDIVLVLDLSKSMLAEQPSRIERARRSLVDFADLLESRGGHRVALVVFAAHAKLQFPLTRDYDHLRFVLAQVDPDLPPPALRPAAQDKVPSGTRIGEALRIAVAAHDPGRSGWQDIILVSDGDDPAGDDEWQIGVQEAHRSSLPIHVVAVGDPRAPHPIRVSKDLLRHDAQVVQSKLNEPLLQEIARRTGGYYFPAHLSDLPLGRLLRAYLETRPQSPAHQADLQLPQPESRHGWFLLAALMFLTGSVLVQDGVPITPPRSVSSRAVAASIALLLVSAEPLASVEDLVRQGNAAFARREYDRALAWYSQAEPVTDDPGLVAFNKAVTYFRLQRFGDAALHYQRCLEDQAAAPERKARASYNLGTALLHGDTTDRRRLEDAIQALRQCLDVTPPGDLRTDAQVNLEIAKRLWLQAKPRPASENANTQPQGPDKSQAVDSRPQDHATQGFKNGTDERDPGNQGKKGPHKGPLDAKKKLAHGPLQVLPDSSELRPLEADESFAHLERLVERIRRERRESWLQVTPAAHVKDW